MTGAGAWEIRAERRFLALPHGRVHVRLSGRQGAPFLLLLHQTPDSSRAWDHLAPYLEDDWFLVAPDTPGYGDSDPLGTTPTMATYAAIMAEVLDRLGVERAAVVGHHTGSGVAVELAAAYPARITGLVLAGVPYWPQGTADRIASLQPPPPPDPSGRHLLAAWERIQERAPDATPEILQRRVVDRLRAPDPAIAYHAVYRYPIQERLPLVRCPALILDGADDPLHASAAAAAALLPGARVESIPGAGVSAVDLFPAVFAARVTSFLGGPVR